MNDIEEKYAAEVKEKKKKIKRAAGEQHEEEEAEKQVDEPEEEEEDPQQTELKHMLVGEEPNLPIPEQELKGEKLEKARIFISNHLSLIDYFLTIITIRIKRSVLISEKTSIIYGEFLRWEYPQIIHFSNVIPRL